jgi:hypothetical protein
MSTRSVIAVPYGDSWRGRYHHSDGYPSGLGAELFRLVNEQGLEWTRTTLTKKHTGWSFILGADWSQEPGFVNKRYGKNEQGEFVRLDSRPNCYCHGERQEKGWWIKREGDDSGTEWAYVLGNLGLLIEKRVMGKYPEGPHNQAQIDAWYKTAKWETVASIAWTSAEPDWKQIQDMAYAEKEG